MSLSGTNVTRRSLFLVLFSMYEQILIDLDNLLLCLNVILPIKLLSDLASKIPLTFVYFHSIEESRVREGRLSSTAVSLCLPHIGLISLSHELVLCRKQTSVEVPAETVHDLFVLHLAQY